MFPGIDVSVIGGLVAIPPSAGREWIQSFDDLDFPELPVWFCELVLAERSNTGATSAGKVRTGNSMLTKERNDVALEIVHECIRDRSTSSYEFALSVHAFLRGLDSN